MKMGLKGKETRSGESGSGGTRSGESGSGGQGQGNRGQGGQGQGDKVREIKVRERRPGDKSCTHQKQFRQ